MLLTLRSGVGDGVLSGEVGWGLGMGWLLGSGGGILWLEAYLVHQIPFHPSKPFLDHFSIENKLRELLLSKF